jgi:tight adherence protein B
MLGSLGSPWLFLGLVFLAVFLLVQGLVVPVFGEASRMRRALLARLSNVTGGAQQEVGSLLREKHLKELSPHEQRLESLPGFARFARIIEQSGRSTPVYRVIALSLLLAGSGAMFGWSMTRVVLWAVLGAIAGLVLPDAKIMRDRTQRIAKVEEQMPEALDVVKRALKAGHPFSQALKLVAEDMQDPIGHEFDLVFSEINYGGDLRTALLGLLERVPSVTVMALVTAVLVQKETGGNLAETFERIAVVIRGRFKLHRRVRTLTAEARLSAWVLALVPLVLFAAISITTPNYMPMLFKDPMGKNLIAGAIVLGIIGILWIRRILQIQV